MKRSMLAVFLILIVAAGCDDSSNPAVPGDPADPDLGTYLNQYDGLVEFTGLQIFLPIEVVDAIFSAAPSVGLGLEQGAYTLDYNETTKFWVFTSTECDGSGPDSMCFAIRDSLQLRQGTVASQYPDSVTSVRSFLTVGISGGNFDHADSHQYLTYSIVTEDPTVLRIDGPGGVDAAFTDSETETSGTTDCDIAVNVSVAINDVILEFDAADCPTGGSLVHSGPTSITCTGAHAGTVSGSWSTTENYDTDQLVVVGEGKRWESELVCHLFGSSAAPRLSRGPLAAASAWTGARFTPVQGWGPALGTAWGAIVGGR